jgi:hypothetical protein
MRGEVEDARIGRRGEDRKAKRCEDWRISGGSECEVVRGLEDE